MKKMIRHYCRYTISSEGIVFGLTGIMKLQNIKGYKSVVLTNDYGSQRFLVHRLVALHFIPNLYYKPFVLHKDGSRDNNNYKNLYWGTAKENTDDSIRQGTFACGIKRPEARLTEKQVKSIKRLRGHWLQKTLAKKYGVTRKHISQIQLGKRWKHVHISIRHRNKMWVRNRRRTQRRVEFSSV